MRVRGGLRRRGILLIVLAVAAAVLVVGLLLVRSWLLGDNTKPLSVTDVVDRYRADRTATTALPAGVTIPAAGVYTYATTGFERVSLFGGSRHAYPAQTTITIRPQRCGYVQTWAALDKRSETWAFCAQPGALRPTNFRDVHSFYGHTDDRRYRCRGGALPLRTDAPAATITCAEKDTTRTDRVRVVGAERVAVGGRAVATIHLRIDSTMSGRTRGPTAYDSWLDRETGLPVRIVTAAASDSDTAIGATAHYVERADLRLTSLRPTG